MKQICFILSCALLNFLFLAKIIVHFPIVIQIIASNKSNVLCLKILMKNVFYVYNTFTLRCLQDAIVYYNATNWTMYSA